MKTALRHILCLISLFLLTTGLNGQNSKEYDAKLNQYELLCEECLDLRTLVASGAEVSRTHAAGLINDFVAMNKEFKALEEAMNSRQKSRFMMINRWFSSGKRPLAMDHVTLDSVNIDLTYKATRALSVTDTFQIASTKRGAGYYLTMPHQNRVYTYIMADLSVPLSYGLMIGLKESSHPDDKGIRWGGYTRLRSNLKFLKGSYSCSSDGTIDKGYAFLGNGNSMETNIIASAGILTGLTSWLDIYAGAGYGQRELLWQDIDGHWASVSDLNSKGIAFEIGMITSWRFLCLGIGISSIKLHTASLDLSIGLRFR